MWIDVYKARHRNQGGVLSNYYKNEYREQKKEIISDKYIEKQEKRAKAQYKYYKHALISDKKSILEIGCGIGASLYLLKNENSNNMLYGFEPDPNLCYYAKERLPEAKIIQDMYQFGTFEENTFDLIILSHVFEHFDNIREYLEEFKRILKPGGILFVEVPNENLYKVVYNMNYNPGRGHLGFYTQKTLTEVLQQYFRILSIKNFGQNLEVYLLKSARVLPNFFCSILPSRLERKCKNGLFIRAIAKKDDV